MKAKITSRKFYGKWLYKVSLEQEGVSIFRNLSPDLVVKWADEPKMPRYYSFYEEKKSWPHRELLKEIAEFLMQYPQDIWSKRIEHNQIDVYSNDKAFYIALCEKFDARVLHKFEPAEGTLEQLADAFTMIVKKLPHDRYNYRVYLQPHKLAGKPDEKRKFVDWLKIQSRITCTSAIEQWFIKTEWNWDRRYVLVEDEPTLLMLKLRNSDAIGRVYKFVVGDK